MRQKTGVFFVVSIVDPDIHVTNLILAWFLIKKNANIWMIATDKHYARLIQAWNNHNHIFVIVCSHNCKTIEVWMLISIMHICKTALKVKLSSFKCAEGVFWANDATCVQLWWKIYQEWAGFFLINPQNQLKISNLQILHTCTKEQ